MKQTKTLFGIAVTVVLLALTLFLLRDFNIVWTKVNEDHAKVTINFLIPMAKDKLEEAIHIKSNKLYNGHFTSQIQWDGPHTCTILIEETGDIQGQNITLLIDNAPTLYKGISKNASIPIQFKSPIQILEPTEELLITTDKPFYVQFNTPMDEHTLSKNLQSDAQFYIEALKRTDEQGRQYKDETTFMFTPKTKLENNHNYLLSFRKGMPSKAGNLLDETIQLGVKTDELPLIERVIPKDGSKWVGLYPRITVESETPLEAAYLELDGELLQGIVKNEYRVDFYPSVMLKPDKTYNASVQIQAHSGELSKKEEVSFTTVPLPANRIWVEVFTGNNQELRVYEGEKEIKRFVCSGGSKTTPTPVGTYYLQEKGESYYDQEAREGANYKMVLSEGIIVHGMSRDEHWQLKQGTYNRLGEGQTKGKIILKEEDALWLYEHLPVDAMIIIHE
ncbi:MAG: L,D-transpeptidase [Cellulosilyticaceae bacterium]